MDEKGSLMDLEDIRHAARKLYQSMHVPSSRNPYSEDEPRFSFDSTEVSQEEWNFYIFVARIRIPLTKMIKQVLRRQLVATGVFTDKEWRTYEKKIKINFTAESAFMETMKAQKFMDQIENFVNIKESIGEVISLESAVNSTLGWSSEQLREELEKIEKERTNPIYKSFYSAADAVEGGDGGAGMW
jgi:isochorismate hydrolase